MQVAWPAIVDAKELFTIRNEVGLYWPFTPKVCVAGLADPPLAISREPVVGGGESERIPAHDCSSVYGRFRLTARQAVTVCCGAE